MDARLKMLRKKLGLTQQEFADRLNIKRGAIANYEIGRNEPIDAVISLICREFGVNEVWLRTGEGGDDNMFAKLDPEDRYSISIGKISMTEDSLVQNIVNAVADATPEELRAVEKFMKRCLGLD